MFPKYGGERSPWDIDFNKNLDVMCKWSVLHGLPAIPCTDFIKSSPNGISPDGMHLALDPTMHDARNFHYEEHPVWIHIESQVRKLANFATPFFQYSPCPTAGSRFDSSRGYFSPVPTLRPLWYEYLGPFGLRQNADEVVDFTGVPVYVGEDVVPPPASTPEPGHDTATTSASSTGLTEGPTPAEAYEDVVPKRRKRVKSHPEGPPPEGSVIVLTCEPSTGKPHGTLYRDPKGVDASQFGQTKVAQEMLTELRRAGRMGEGPLLREGNVAWDKPGVRAGLGTDEAKSKKGQQDFP